jgi:cell division septation protein DedD
MGQAESDSKPPRGRTVIICAALFLLPGIPDIFPQSESDRASASTASSSFQETRPRRVGPPAANGRAGANSGNPADPPPVRPISPARKSAAPSSASNVRAQSFTVQLGAFLNRENARRLAGLLETRGYAPDISTKMDAHKRVWHLVRVGSHPDRQSASTAASEIERKLKMKAIVRPANSL